MTTCTDVNEGATHVVRASFLDDEGDPVVPSAVRYRIDDVESDQEILGDTTFGGALASAIDLVITPEENAIVNDKNFFERRAVTVEFDYATDRRGVDVYEYRVRNLAFKS